MLSNELLFLIFLLGGSLAVLIASYFGKNYIYAVIISIAIYVGIAEANVIEVLGFPTTLGTALYAVIFFASDMLTERYGRAAGYAGVRYSLTAVVLFQLFMQLTLLSHPVAEMAWFSEGLHSVFTTSFRIVVSGLCVYALSQSLDVWIYSKIHEKTGDKHLWMRNNGSTMISQAVDTYLFTFLAFYGVFDNWVAMATTGYCFKLVVSVCDTGFMYFSKIFTPLDLRDDKKSV